jgi:hypothetical protein
VIATFGSAEHILPSKLFFLKEDAAVRQTSRTNAAGTARSIMQPHYPMVNMRVDRMIAPRKFIRDLASTPSKTTAA